MSVLESIENKVNQLTPNSAEELNQFLDYLITKQAKLAVDKKYLVDTNVWLERLLDQDKSEVVAEFLNKVPLDNLYISDFAFHSIGVILSRYSKYQVLGRFVNDLAKNGQIEQLSLNYQDFSLLLSNINNYNLDFDDAYQLTVAQKFDLTIVSFDNDFNVAGIDKLTPEEIIALL